MSFNLPYRFSSQPAHLEAAKITCEDTVDSMNAHAIGLRRAKKHVRRILFKLLTWESAVTALADDLFLSLPGTIGHTIRTTYANRTSSTRPAYILSLIQVSFFSTLLLTSFNIVL